VRWKLTSCNTNHGSFVYAVSAMNTVVLPTFPIMDLNWMVNGGQPVNIISKHKSSSTPIAIGLTKSVLQKIRQQWEESAHIRCAVNGKSERCQYGKRCIL
jgi:hypothetical protein